MLYSLTEDEGKIRITEMEKLKSMEVVSFFQLLNTFQIRMDAKIENLKKLNNGKGKA